LTKDGERPHLAADQFTSPSKRKRISRPKENTSQITRKYNMPQTRAQQSSTSSTSRSFQSVYHTPDQTRFFDALHAKPPDQAIGAFVKQHKHQEWCPCGNTLRRWLQQEAESTRTPTRRPPEKPRGRPALSQAALDQVEIMARGPRDLRLRNWQYHADQAGASIGTMRR
jgi:hypothetical protein